MDVVISSWSNTARCSRFERPVSERDERRSNASSAKRRIEFNGMVRLAYITVARFCEYAHSAKPSPASRPAVDHAYEPAAPGCRHGHDQRGMHSLQRMT